MPDRVDDGEPDAVLVHGVVEGVPTDRVGGFEDAAHRDAGGRAGERREEVPLQLGGDGQGLDPSGAVDDVGVPPLADEDEGQEPHDRRQEVEQVVGPGGVGELEDAHQLVTVGQRHRHDGRVGAVHHDLVLYQRPPGEGAVDGLAVPGRPVDAQLLEGEQSVVGHQEAGGVCAEQAAGRIDDLVELTRGELRRTQHQADQRLVAGLDRRACAHSVLDRHSCPHVWKWNATQATP